MYIHTYTCMCGNRMHVSINVCGDMLKACYELFVPNVEDGGWGVVVFLLLV